MVPSIRGILHAELVLFLTFWLVVIAPVTCQYHGLLITYADPVMEVDHHDHFAAPTDASGAAPLQTDSVRNHELTTTVTMSFFVMVLPDHVTLPVRAPLYFDLDLPEPATRQAVILPLERPPRVAV